MPHGCSHTARWEKVRKGEKRNVVYFFLRSIYTALRKRCPSISLKVLYLHAFVFLTFMRLKYAEEEKLNIIYAQVVFVTLIYVFSLFFYVKQTKSWLLQPSWPSEQVLKQCVNAFLSWLFLHLGYWFGMVSKSFWHFSDCLAKVLMTEEETNGTDQLLSSGHICIKHKRYTRN